MHGHRPRLQSFRNKSYANLEDWNLTTEAPGNTPQKPVRYLTAQEVADRYGMKIDWVYGCRSLPRRKLGKSLRFLESELDEWEKRHTSASRVFTFHHFDPRPVNRKFKLPPQEERDRLAEPFALAFDMEESGK